jgi:hypothetical protein
MFTKKRPDGTYIRNLHFFTQMMPYLLPTRAEAVIYFEQEIDVTNTFEYIRKRKRAAGGADTENNNVKITLFYIILFAAIRTIALKPRMNRFVSGYRFYQRNRISFNFVAKRDLSEEGEEINVTMSFSPLLSLEGFCKKIHDHISSLKMGETTNTEKTNSFVSNLPRFLIRFAVWGLKFLDYHNALPKSVIDSMPFFSTIFFTNVGSIGMDAPLHHNFEIGNCGIFCAIGKVRKVNILKSDGTVERRDKMKLTFTYDDRITDGFYCARAIDMLGDFIENPEKLETPLELTAEQLSNLGLAASEL